MYDEKVGDHCWGSMLDERESSEGLGERVGWCRTGAEMGISPGG